MNVASSDEQKKEILNNRAVAEQLKPCFPYNPKMLLEKYLNTEMQGIFPFHKDAYFDYSTFLNAF